jgi:hypothetical protein
MTRLPINFLLYLTSLGLAAGCAWIFYQTMSQRHTRVSPEEIYSRAKDRLERGRKLTPDDQRDDYSKATQPWWLSFQEANFTGVQAAPPPEAAAAETEAPPEAVLTPIEEILDVVFIAFSSAGDSRCAVRYKPTANVQPPHRGPGGGVMPGAAGYAGPADVRAAARPAPPPPPVTPGTAQAGAPAGGQPAVPGAVPGQPSAMPSFPANQEVIQLLTVGESLWPEYEHITLARVDESGTSVYFRRAAPGGEGPVGEAEERVFRNELGLTKEIMEALADGGITISGPLARPVREVEETESAMAPSGTQWMDVPETKQIQGEWHISKQDHDMLSQDAQTVFNQDIGLQSYTSKEGGVRGIQVTHVSPRLERFGVQSGDVLIELNGVPVDSKAKALKVGKEQYKTGVREFRAKVLTRYGNMEERVYHAPQ